LFTRSGQLGLSLIEGIIFVILVAIAIAGIMGVVNTVTAHSSDPMVRKQALAIAEALLEEVQLMPMTYCDPDDTSVLTATSGSLCAAGNDQTTTAPQSGESRYATAAPFDNVADYNGFDTSTATPSGIRDIGSNLMTGLNGYRATVSVTPSALVGTDPDSTVTTVAAGTAVLISVAVTGPHGESVRLQSYRTRYAPRNP